MICPVCSNEFVPNTIGRPQTYCTVACRQLQYNAKRKTAKHTVCDIIDCENTRRSARSMWCETHYARNYRNGSPEALKKRKSWYCEHCNERMDTRRRFCDSLCRRRNRIGAVGREIFCITCNNALPIERMYGSVYCNRVCELTAARARRVGLLPNDLWQKLLTTQKCEICGAIVKDLHLDHNHNTGLFRGFLCGGCNVGIGMLKESQEILKKAIDYLDRTA